MCARIDRSTCLVEPSCWKISHSCFSHFWHHLLGCLSRLFFVNLGSLSALLSALRLCPSCFCMMGQLRRFPPSLGHGFPCSLHCTSSTSVSSIILSESSSASFSLIVTCSATMFVGRLVFWTVWCVRHFALWAVVVGHPRPPRLPAPPVYRGCPCRDPLGCPPMPSQDGIGSRAPTLVCVRCWW